MKACSTHRRLDGDRRRGAHGSRSRAPAYTRCAGSFSMREVQERHLAPVPDALRRSRATSREARPRPRWAASVQTALISVKPGGCMRSPAIATARRPSRTPRYVPSSIVRVTNGPGFVRSTSASISGTSASAERLELGRSASDLASSARRERRRQPHLAARRGDAAPSSRRGSRARGGRGTRRRRGRRARAGRPTLRASASSGTRANTDDVGLVPGREMRRARLPLRAARSARATRDCRARACTRSWHGRRPASNCDFAGRVRRSPMTARHARRHGARRAPRADRRRRLHDRRRRDRARARRRSSATRSAGSSASCTFGRARPRPRVTRRCGCTTCSRRIRCSRRCRCIPTCCRSPSGCSIAAACSRG